METNQIQCRDGDGPAYAVDREYDEGYCLRHFHQQQESSEPISDYYIVSND